MDEEILVFGSEDEVRSAMYGSDTEFAKKVTQAIIDGRVSIGVQEDVAEEVVDEPAADVDDEPINEQVDNSIELEEETQKLKEYFEEQTRLKEEEFAKRAQELEEKLHLYEKEQEEKKKTASLDVEVELDDEDPDLASNFSRNTRKLVEAQLSKIREKVESPELEQEIIALKNKLAESEEKERRAAQLKEAEENRRKLFAQLESFAKGKPEFEMDIPLMDAREQQLTFKEQIAKVMSPKNDDELERIYRRVVKENSSVANEYRKRLIDNNVKIPEGSDKYLNIVEVYELQRGVKYNTKIGAYEDYQLTLDDVYKLKDMGRIVNDAARNEAREIKKKLETQATAAITIDNSSTSDVSGSVAYTADDINKALRMSANDLLRNKSLAKMYATYLRDTGKQVPRSLSNL